MIKYIKEIDSKLHPLHYLIAVELVVALILICLIIVMQTSQADQIDDSVTNPSNHTSLNVNQQDNPSQPPFDNQPVNTEPSPNPVSLPPNNPPASEIPKLPEDPSNPTSQKRLTALWNILSLSEKIALNPYNCPIKTNQVNLDINDGACLDASSPLATEPAFKELTSINKNQSFEINLRNLNLKISLLETQCSISSDVLKKITKTDDLSSLQTLYKQFSNNQNFEFLDQLYKNNQIYLIDAFSYLESLQTYLSANITGLNTDNIWSYLDSYQHCQIVLEAENIGADSQFGNLCGLDLNEDVWALDQQNMVYRSKYIGAAFGCAEAMMPFPNGAKTKSSVDFALAKDRQIDYLIFADIANKTKILIKNSS